MTAGGAGLPLWPHPLCLGVVWRPIHTGRPTHILVGVHYSG